LVEEVPADFEFHTGFWFVRKILYST